MPVDSQSRKTADRHRLNDRFVKTVKPSDKRTFYWDTVQHGFALSVEPTGHKSYKLVYSIRGRPRWFTIGSASRICLKDARQIAREKMADVYRGIDVQAERTSVRTQLTFGELAERYVEEHAKRRKKSWKQADTLVRSHLLPRWGKLQGQFVSRSDVRAVFNSLTNKGAEVLANQVLAAASAIFSWAMKHDIGGIESNPRQGIERNPTKARERVLSERELPLVWNALGDVGLAQGRALRMVLLTGQRPGDVVHMRWRDLDLGEHRFTDKEGRSYVAHGGWRTLPGEADDNGWPGTKNGQTHQVWLSPMAATVRDELDGDGQRLVFAGARGAAARGLGEAMRRICASLRFNDAVKPHDLRRTHGTIVTSLRYSRDQMNRIQNHKDGAIASVYDRHNYAHEAKLIQEAVAIRIAEIARLNEKT